MSTEANKSYVIESPIEQIMLDQLLPAISTATSLQTQKAIGRARVDFLLTARGQNVVIECDGRDYHEFWEDRQRDLVLLRMGVDHVFRFRGSDIHFDRESCLRWLRSFLPFLFDADAAPLDLAGKALLSHSIASSTNQPIYRFNQDMHACKPGDGKCGTHGAVVMIDNRWPTVVVQIKSPHWSWKYRGPRIGLLSDGLAEVLDAITKEKGGH